MQRRYLGVKWSQVQILSARQREACLELRRFVVNRRRCKGLWDQFGTTLKVTCTDLSASIGRTDTAGLQRVRKGTHPFSVRYRRASRLL